MLTLKAPAKINWFLKVLGRREDGFHEIQTLMQKTTLHDVLTFAPSDDLVLNSDTEIPAEDNLIYRAAILMKSTYGVEAGASIHLQKNIPVGAGLGGGSSDAAAALLGLNKLWNLNLSKEQLCAIAEELGSDVPFFLYGALSYAYGRGEKLVPCKALKPLNIVLVKPHFDVSTAWVYKNFAMLTKKDKKVNNIEHFIRHIERAELRGITDCVSNDLESVTINSFPVIAEIKDVLRKQGALFSLMSGSGPTVYGVFDSHKMAEDASRVVNKFWTSVVETVI